MSSSILNRTEEFFDRLEKALGHPSPQNREILAEVRGDFMAQVESLRHGGVPEGEAVDHVLEEMGAPEAMALEMKRVLPPLSSGPVTVVRYLLAGGLIVWTLLVMWTARAWDYGLGLSPLVMLVLHFPVILALWPRIVWRKNWLFGVVPAGVLVLVAVALNLGGAETTGVILLEQVGVPSVATEELSSAKEFRWQPMVLGGSFAVAAAVLISMIQRKRQRLMVLAFAILPLVMIEAPFQWEEHVFRQQRDRIQRLVVDPVEPLPERGKLSDLGLSGRERVGGTYSLAEGRDFKMWWPRPLSPGFSICYSSGDDRIWVND